MQLSAHAISVKGPHAPMLAPTSVSVADHELVLLAGDPGVSHTAASLGLSGRLRVDGGGVQLDGKADMAGLRRRVAVVDTPGITEPDDALPVRTVIGEELAIAGRKAGRRAVREWLEANDATAFGDMRFEHLPVDVRTRLLAELTVARSDVQVVILTLPDRLGGDPHHWYEVGRDLAARGYGVVITCSESSVRILDVPAARLGSLDPPPPVQVAPAEPVEAAPLIEESEAASVEQFEPAPVETEAVTATDTVAEAEPEAETTPEVETAPEAEAPAEVETAVEEVDDKVTTGSSSEKEQV